MPKRMATDASDTTARHRAIWAQVCQDLYQRLILRARRLTNDRLSDAEDLVQETVCRVLIYPSNPMEVRTPLGYLLRMMRNIWIDQWVKEKRENTDSLDDILSGTRHPTVESDVLRILENEELNDQMSSKLVGLTSREKLLLQLHLEGYKCKDIADTLNEDARITRSDLNAVRAKLRYRLTKANAKTSVSGLP
jgi:RNA polymerase sigma factor (sigma-70 family)